MVVLANKILTSESMSTWKQVRHWSKIHNSSGGGDGWWSPGKHHHHQINPTHLPKNRDKRRTGILSP